MVKLPTKTINCHYLVYIRKVDTCEAGSKERRKSEHSQKSKFQDWYNHAYIDLNVKMTTLLEKMIVPTLAQPEFDYTN